MNAQTTKVTKEERLLNLLAALRSTSRGLSKSDVRRLVHGYAGQKDDAFERMFERDKDSLRSIGAPLLTLVSPVHQSDIVYRVDGDDTGVTELSLTAQEAAVLAAAAGVWRDAATSASARRGLTKLRGRTVEPGTAAGPHDDEDGDADVGASGRTSSGPSTEDDTTTEAAALRTAPGVGLADAGPAFTVILEALEHGRAVRFDYRAASTGELSNRLVDPWRLATRGRSWYLVGHDHDRGAVRVFHLSRVRGKVRAVETEDRVQPPADLDLSAVLMASSRRGGQARVALAPGRGGALRTQAGWAPDENHPGTTPDDHDHQGPTSYTRDLHDRVPDGWDTVELTTADLDDLAGEIAALGDGALALAPDDLVSTVRRRLSRAAEVAESRALDAPGTKAAPAAKIQRDGAEVRLARLLAIVLRLHEHGDQTVAGLAELFGVGEKQIIKDIELLWVTGLPGYQHDDLIDFSVDAFESGVVSLANDQGLARPMRLTTDEAVLLLVALGPMRAVAESGDLSTVLIDQLVAKLEEAAGEASSVARSIDVPVPDADEVAALSTVRSALEQGRRLHLEYVSAGDVRTERDVDVRSIVNDAGDWRVSAWCLRAGAPRTFRVDRIVSATVLPVPVEEHPWPARTDQVGDSGDEVVVELASIARPFAETVPSISTKDLDDGGVRVRLRVADEAWFVGAMLDLGDDVTAIGPAAWAKRVRAAARAALDRYDDGEPVAPA
ncbi:helix-turn-helix transcriptional regulator [Georgenia sp. Z1344]|uniref:helix-turn-helix transcriptional regulator n=1 Tax=Georgenia sp. Z1344 TaxID=3416706 RepID=UPI003CEAEC88